MAHDLAHARNVVLGEAVVSGDAFLDDQRAVAREQAQALALEIEFLSPEHGELVEDAVDHDVRVEPGRRRPFEGGDDTRALHTVEIVLERRADQDEAVALGLAGRAHAVNDAHHIFVPVRRHEAAYGLVHVTLSHRGPHR